MAGADRDVEVWVGADHVISAALPPGEAPMEVDGRTVTGEGVDWVWTRLGGFRDRDRSLQRAVRRHRARTAAAPLPRVGTATIVIATKDRPELVARSVPAAVAAADVVPGTEVIVVAQGTPPGRVEGVTVIEDSGVGASRARNLGVRHATGDVVLFTDDDCIVPASWVADHLAAMGDTVVATFGVVGGLSRSGGDDPVVQERVHRDGAMPWHVGHGSNMAVRVAAFDAVGGWDERIGPGTPMPTGEDADLIVRLLEHGAVRTGVGEPVGHIAWRTEEDDAANLRAYEVGAGVWIGKALRARGRAAAAFVRGRRRLLVMRWRTGDRKEAVGAAVSFARGLVRGYRLR